MPKSSEEVFDEELARLKNEKLQQLLEEKHRTNQLKMKQDTRQLTRSQQMALKALETGRPYEVVQQTVDFGPADPVTKQVSRFHSDRKGVVVTLELEPEEKQWLEHLMLVLRDIPLKRSETELVMKHIRRLNYEGELKDYYEFYGLTLKELEEKEEEERALGHVAKADRLRAVIETQSGRK